jgi:hypothetical protein
MSFAKWTCGVTLAVVSVATMACGAAPDGSESTEEGQAADTKQSGARSSPNERIGGGTPFCLPGEKVVCTLGPPPVCHCELTTTLPIERLSIADHDWPTWPG